MKPGELIKIKTIWFCPRSDGLHEKMDRGPEDAIDKMMFREYVPAGISRQMFNVLEQVAQYVNKDWNPVLAKEISDVLAKARGNV